MRPGWIAAFTTAIFLSCADASNAACRQALGIGLDISGSVDSNERRLQLDGMADALTSVSVVNAFVAMPDAPVRLMIYEWSGDGTQHLIVDWRDVTDATVLQEIAARLRATTYRPPRLRTALGRAMLFGARALNAQGDCWRRTLDIAGDGQSNFGPRPRDVRSAPELANITVNALVIGSDGSGGQQNNIAELSAYFRAEVIKGADAFVETALGFENFQRAMERKLLKELQSLAVSALPARYQ